MKKVAIIGSGNLAQHIAHYLKESTMYTIYGFYDDFKQEGNKTPNGLIQGKLLKIENDFKKGAFEELVVGIGYNHLEFRKQIFTKYLKFIPFTTFIHPSCHIDSSCTIGKGVIVLPGCIFDKDVTVGDNNFFNIGCTVAHDTQIGNNNFFGPSVKMAGFVKIDENCFVGIGSTIIDNISICANTQTGGGSVIVKSITSPGLYAGVPARLLR